MSYLYHDDEAEFLDNGARPGRLERDDDAAVYWREQCRKPVEGLRPFVWHGNEPERLTAGRGRGI